MAYRELLVVEIVEILRLWQRGHGYRTVAERTSVDRKTVRRYVEAAQALGLSRDEESVELDDAVVAGVATAVKPGAPVSSGEMRSHCREHAKLLDGWLDDGCKGPKLVKLLARHSGVVVPLRTLQRFMSEELGRDGPRRDTVRLAPPPAGQVLEVDFLELGWFVERGTGRRRKMHALLCVASHSGHQFAWPTLDQTQQDVIEGLEAAWRFFGGVFPVLLPDNLKAVVTTPDALKPKLNEAFVEYAQARGFEIDPARVRKPQDKARVERQVQYVRNDFFRGERFGDVEEARREAERWCREDAGMRTHGTTRQQPLVCFEQDEQPLLGPAPTEPYDAPTWATHKVGRDHTVVVEHAMYSVPHHIGEVTLRVRLDRTTVKLYDGAQLVKVHPREKPGEASLDPADLPPGKMAMATRSGESLQRLADAAGEHVGEYARRLLAGPLPWTRMRQVYRLLGLVSRFGDVLTNEACEQALGLDVVDVTRIDRMLERGLVRRGFLAPAPVAPAKPRDNVVPLRFARDPREFKTPRSPRGGPDAPA